MKKGYKITNVERTKKVGVAAETLAELIEKSKIKLKVNVDGCDWRLYVAEDGTLVDDDEYLATLPPQTLLVLLKDNDKMITDFDFYYNMVRSSKREYLEIGDAAKEFLDKNLGDKFKVFQKYIDRAENALTMISDRKQDPAWFEGLEPSEKTKEQSMSKRVKERMRGYFYKTKSALTCSEFYIHSKSGRGKKLIDQFLADLRKLLEASKYNETYFNRKADEQLRLCDDTGLFVCGGLWHNSKCVHERDHIINPYRSREERIIFQTWNLDHRIELSRSVIPKILESCKTILDGDVICFVCNKHVGEGKIESDRYYLQIFTKQNLKLVHIVCHHKGKHDAASDTYTVCDKCFSINKN